MFRAARLALYSTLTIALAASVGSAHIGDIHLISDTEDDATIVLRHTRPVISNDGRTYCSVRVIVVGTDVEISDGDTVEVNVWEDDGVLGDNDPILQQFVFVTPDEVRAQRFDRTFNCSGRFNRIGEDEETIDVRASAAVVKEECGAFCRDDRPTAWNEFHTSRHTADRLELHEVDGNEGVRDDSLEGAVLLERGVLVRDLSAIDEDWRRIELEQPSIIDLSLDALIEEGRVDLYLTDADGQLVMRAAQNERGASLRSEWLDPGTYYARILPLVDSDYSFYSIVLNVTERPRECEADATEDRDCGLCGRQIRDCQNDGSWSPWGGCQNEGVCAPGATADAGCEFCGIVTSTCNAACVWEAGACVNQGTCEVGAVDTEACSDEGNRSRTCDAMCAWGDFGECISCVDGAQQDCYSGAEGTVGVGDCRVGVQGCENGQWSVCEGEVTPAEERCGDDADGDCDGIADADEEVCQPRCGNGLMEADEECDEISTDCADCLVQATDVSEGGIYLGSYQEASFDRFSFELLEEAEVTIRQTGADGICGPQGDMSLTFGDQVIIGQENQGCTEIAATLDAGAYEVRVSGPDDLGARDYRLEVEFVAAMTALPDMEGAASSDIGQDQMVNDGGVADGGAVSRSGDGCRTTGHGNAPLWIAVALFGLGLIRRRA